MEEGAAKGCRVVVMPEGALGATSAPPRMETDAAVEAICRATAAAGIYAIVGMSYRFTDEEAPHQRLVVIEPDGAIGHVYDKIWHDPRFEPPGIFRIDGVPCGATICADRWVRATEELTALDEAKILFELSGNFRNEWVSDLGWYWYVPRAMRNSVYVVLANIPRDNPGIDAKSVAQSFLGHGHSAIIAPDGALVAGADDEGGRLLIATVDVSRATRAEARKRRQHPLFAAFWETGLALLHGRETPSLEYEPVTSKGGIVRVAAAQMACDRSIDDNVARMGRIMHTAKANGANAVAFPELAATGAGEQEVKRAGAAVLEVALAKLRSAAREAGITAIFGTPWFVAGRRFNSAFVIDESGEVLTRYDQLAPDRPHLFAAGSSTRAMWFQIKDSWSVVTIGRDALWSELAELAAWRGAVLQFHLAYAAGDLPVGGERRGLRMDADRMDVDGEGWSRQTPVTPGMARRQLWTVFAGCNMLSVTVNAARPVSLLEPGLSAEGGSAIWQDFGHGSFREEGGFAPHSAVRIAEAGSGEEIIYGDWNLPTANKQVSWILNSIPRWQDWFAAGAQAIYSETDTK